MKRSRGLALSVAVLSIVGVTRAVTSTPKSLAGMSHPRPEPLIVAESASAPILASISTTTSSTLVLHEALLRSSRSAPLATTTTESQPVQTTGNYAGNYAGNYSSEPTGYTTAAYPAVGMAPRNATEACISDNENHGSYGRSSNATHFGRWQFDYRTWVGGGGAGSHWGYASPAEQDEVFRSVVAANGYGQWTRYDGC